MLWEWWISRLCEEFHCRPSQAIQEWETAPCGLLETIIECRAFAAAYQAYDSAQKKSDVPQTPMVQLVKAIEFALVQEELSAADGEPVRD